MISRTSLSESQLHELRREQKSSAFLMWSSSDVVLEAILALDTDPIAAAPSADQ